MSEPFLIAHLVRGEPAFDIATQMPCPECHAIGCPECDEEGFWWIVPTSGHRAYPWHSISLHTIEGLGLGFESEFGPAPEGWPDHYAVRSAPSNSNSNGSGLLAALGLNLRPTSSPIRRRV